MDNPSQKTVHRLEKDMEIEPRREGKHTGQEWGRHRSFEDVGPSPGADLLGSQGGENLPRCFARTSQAAALPGRRLAICPGEVGRGREAQTLLRCNFGTSQCMN